MMRFCGFCPGQYGDLYMMTVAARCLKREVPGCHITFVISGLYREAAPIFLDHPDIDRVHILHKERDGFDQMDLEWIKRQRFDHVFNPMQDHDYSDPWWKKRKQSLEAAHMHGLSVGADNGKIELARWFSSADGLKDFVAFSPWPSFHEGMNNPKAVPLKMAQLIVDRLLKEGLKVLQVGGPQEPALTSAIKPQTDYFSSLRNVLGCKAMIMGDSGFNWLLSGYDFPVVGLYSERYFGREFIHNIQPVNPNAAYLTSKTVSQIELDSIFNSLKMLT